VPDLVVPGLVVPGLVVPPSVVPPLVVPPFPERNSHCFPQPGVEKRLKSAKTCDLPTLLRVSTTVDNWKLDHKE
jgi:hypothetical protein